MRLRHITLLLDVLCPLLLTFTLVACGSGTEPTLEDVAPSAPTQPTPEPEGTAPTRPSAETDAATPIRPTPGESPLPEPGPDSFSPLPTPPGGALSAAATYLAAELGIPSQEVAMLSSEPVEWPDASLGCPQPGMGHAQVVTPGYRFILQAGGREYELHTDQTGQSVVICHTATQELGDPQAAFQALLTHLMQTYPGFGLDQQRGWVKQDITKEAVVGTTTWTWRSGEWTLEMTFPTAPQPAYESVLFHQQAGTVWRGTLEASGQVTPVHRPLALSSDVGPCDENLSPDTVREWAGVEIVVQQDVVHIDQVLSYTCCAELALSAGWDGQVVRVIETNVGEVCRCMCGYPIIANIDGLDPGTYTVEVWGVQHFDVHPLELLGSTEVTVP